MLVATGLCVGMLILGSCASDDKVGCSKILMVGLLGGELAGFEGADTVRASG